MSGERVRAWWISIEAPPGYANSCRTPSRSSACTRMSAPFRGSLPYRSTHSSRPVARQPLQSWCTQTSTLTAKAFSLRLWKTARGYDRAGLHTHHSSQCA